MEERENRGFDHNGGPNGAGDEGKEEEESLIISPREVLCIS